MVVGLLLLSLFSLVVVVVLLFLCRALQVLQLFLELVPWLALNVSYSFGMLYLMLFLLRKTYLIVVWLPLLSGTLLLS